jgi:hypothetical protein
VVRRATWRRWSLVAAVTAVLVSLPAIVAAVPVHPAAVPLDQLVARIRGSARYPYQGYVLGSGTAGLPSLPQLGDVTKMLDGETQLRVWYAARDSWRVDTIDTGAERDLYQTPAVEAIWDYGSNQLTAVTGTAPVRLPRGADLVPPDLARRLLATGAGGGDPVSRLPARRVAGRAAAGLRVTPRDPATTIGRVDIWADPATGIPLQVEVVPRGAAAPILVTRFLEFSPTRPAASVLEPPPARDGVGFAVTAAPDLAGVLGNLRFGPLPATLAGRARADGAPAPVAGVGGYGAGFTQFVVLAVPRRTGLSVEKTATDAGGAGVILPGGEGVVISTPLLSVMVVVSSRARRSYILAGMVTANVLKAAATDLSTFVDRGPGPR